MSLFHKLQKDIEGHVTDELWNDILDTGGHITSVNITFTESAIPSCKLACRKMIQSRAEPVKRTHSRLEKLQASEDFQFS